MPSRWKILAGDVHCPQCLASSYVLRTISLPVAGPVDANWDELRPALREAWIDTTRCANWMLTELYKGDVRRAPQDTKLGPMPRTYLYPEGRARFPNLPAQTVAQLENQTRRVYSAQRYELLWLGARSLATMRYPTPLPIPKKGWSLERSPGGAWHLAFFLGQRRWRLRLRGGPQLRRQTEVLSQIVEGTVEAGSLVVRQVSANAGDHRSEALPATRLMVTIPVWIRRLASVPGKGTLFARPTPDLFLLARADNGCEWRLHGGHIRRVVSRSERMHRAIMDDLKAEVRASASGRDALFNRLGAIADRRNGRVSAWLHEASSQLADFAARCRVEAVVYDDRDRTGWPALPWSRFKTLLRQKLDARGISLVEASEEPHPLVFGSKESVGLPPSPSVSQTRYA